MAQSKKDRLKSIRRQFAQVGRTLATAPCDIIILDFYKHVSVDIQETVRKMQGGYPADLQHMTPLVTFQQLDQLHTRVMALQRRLDPAPYDYDVLYAGIL